MIEAISHLIHRDYDAIVNDFVTLDFIAEGTDLSPLSAPLGRVFDQALEGGGAKSINFQELASDLAQITFDFPFRIPPYFAIIIRAIGVLEGIALVGDPDFALVDEAYPYLSKRLLTSNDDERLQEALRYMVYGKSTVFDADRLIDLLEALESFKRDVTTSSGVTAEASINLEKKTSREALQFVLSPQGSFFREFLLDEVVKGVDALSRESAVAVLTSVGLKDAKIPILFPILGLPNSIALAPKVTQEDKETAENVTKLLNFLLGRNESGSTSNENAFSRETFEEMRPFLPAVANQILPTLVERLSSRLAARAVREIFV
jgi:aarF domain-containing kinase